PQSAMRKPIEIPAGTKAAAPGSPAAASKKEDYSPAEMLRTWQFYALWFMYACGAGAGLMIIGKLALIAKVQASLELGFILVAVLAIGNGGGRILAGFMSDKIGRSNTLLVCFDMQAVMIVLVALTRQGSALASPGIMALLSALIGANYGANLALFPSVTKDYYGLKNFGVNYGLVFTAWGLGGFMLSLLAGKVYDQTRTFNFAYYCSAVLLIAAAVVTFFVRPPTSISRNQ
ncbi:MAG: MFS transporter, partial [Limisphaerales bacterium]